LEFSQKKKAVPPKTTTMARAKRRSRKFFIVPEFNGAYPDAKQKSLVAEFCD
tara:strand:- start:806 stop:961 length:156 start_codon:yes stop_codon:yes gene_type:complete